MKEVQAELAAGTRKPTSAAKVDANRRNAQKSTGPKTIEGKAVTRWNALKHGMRAQFLSVLSAEDAEEWAKLLASLHSDLHPIGTLEEMQVVRIALAHFRLNRATAQEAEVILKGNFLPYMDRFSRYITALHNAIAREINLLERQQARRRGDHVPAPIAVDVNLGLRTDALEIFEFHAAEAVNSRGAQVNSTSESGVETQNHDHVGRIAGVNSTLRPGG